MKVFSSGQPRAYADSFWIADVTFKNPEDSTSENVQAIAAKMCGYPKVYFRSATDREWHHPFFNELTQSKEDPNTWRFDVQRMFLD